MDENATSSLSFLGGLRRDVADTIWADLTPATDHLEVSHGGDIMMSMENNRDVAYTVCNALDLRFGVLHDEVRKNADTLLIRDIQNVFWGPELHVRSSQRQALRSIPCCP